MQHAKSQQTSAVGVGQKGPRGGGWGGVFFGTQAKEGVGKRRKFGVKTRLNSTEKSSRRHKGNKVVGVGGES